MSNQYFKERSPKNPITDKPIVCEKQDNFLFNKKIVKNICSFINNPEIGACTIAVTGPWGAGKTSAINLLKAQLSNQGFSLIEFDPLFESKLEISDLLTNFILKLSSILPKSDKVLKQIIKSIGLLVPEKISIGAIGLDFGKVDERIEKLFALWERQNGQIMSSQLKELNKFINNSKKRIVLFIDEIDRLQPDQIIKFLIFSRVFEMFDNVWIVVTLDYERVLDKLMSDQSISQGKHEIAASYIDKFFQVRYELSSSLSNVSLSNYIKEYLAKHEILNLSDVSFSEKQKSDMDESVDNITEILETPRNVKKWILELIRNRALLKRIRYEEGLIGWLYFTAIIVKHPIVLSYFSKNTRNLFFLEEMRSYMSLRDLYNLAEKEDEGPLFFASMGIVTKPDNDNKYKNYMKELQINSIYTLNKDIASKLLLIKNSKFFVNAFLDGIENENDLSILYEFFHGNVNAVLSNLLENSLDEIVLEDIVKKVSRYGEISQEIPELSILNELWKNKANEFNSFYYIVVGLLHHQSLKPQDIIFKTELTLSHKYLNDLLLKYGIKNKGGRYDLDDYNSEAKKVNRLEKDDLKEVLRLWLKNVENKLNNFEEISFSDKEIISVLYRYIQWTVTINGDQSRKQAQSYLVNLVIEILSNQKIDFGLKKSLLEGIEYACASHFTFGDNDPITYLFDANKHLIAELRKFLDISKMKNCLKVIEKIEAKTIQDRKTFDESPSHENESISF